MSRNLDFILWAKGELLKGEYHDMMCIVEWSLARLRGMSWREGKARSRKMNQEGAVMSQVIIMWLYRPPGCRMWMLPPVLCKPTTWWSWTRVTCTEDRGKRVESSKTPREIDIKKDSWKHQQMKAGFTADEMQVMVHFQNDLYLKKVKNE